MNSDVTPTRVNSLSIAEERCQTTGLLLSFYDMLSKEFGVGEWKPMGVQTQVEESLRMSCLVGYSSEYYALAVARPLAPENWDATLARMEVLAEPLGFGPAKKGPPGKDRGRSALFTRRDETRIEIGYKTNSFIRIETGCAKGEVYEGWPAGTEAVPERL